METPFANPYVFGSVILLITAIIYLSIMVYSSKQTLKGTLIENDLLYSKLQAKENAIKLLEESLVKSKSKPLMMYRRAVTDAEKKSGFDYFFIKSFKSHRNAEKETELTRSKISKSLKNKLFVRHPKMIDTLVVFAPYDNELNSNEKHA